jgi:uncharacterized delta-60 repeat protein
MKIKYTILFLLSLIIVSNICFSQQVWVRNFNGSGSGDDKAYAITIDKFSNIYVTGYTTNIGTGSDFCTIKYNSNGVQQWVKCYNGPGNGDDKAYAITVDNSSNVIVTGYSTGIGSHHDFTTIKYSSSGTQIWVQRYNEPGNGDDEAHALAVDDSGNVYVTGFIARVVTDWYTIKYRSSDGQYLWGITYDGEGHGEDKAYAIAVDRDGGIYVTGYSAGLNNFSDYTTIRYNLNGVQQWVSKYNGTGSGDDKAYAITIDRSGYIYVTGWSAGIESSYDYATIKYRPSSGDTVWVARYNGTGNDEDKAYAITVDNSNNIYVTGSSRNAPYSGAEDYLTIKYNSAGDSLWTARYSGISTDIPYALFVSKSDTAVFVTGFSRHDTTQGSEDILTVKYNITNGSQLQECRYNGLGDSTDIAYDITLDSLNDVFLAGFQYSGLGTGNDWVTLKYLRGELIEVQTISSLVPKGFQLFQNYPNPFNPSTKIRFQIPKTERVKMNVYDVLGREVAVLVNENMHAGTYEVNFNSSLLPSGVYFCQLRTNEYRDVKRMVLIK